MIKIENMGKYRYLISIVWELGFKIINGYVNFFILLLTLLIINIIINCANTNSTDIVM